MAQCYDIPWPHWQTVNWDDWDDISIATNSIVHLVAILLVITVSLMA